MTTVLVDFNGTLEIDGEANAALIERIRARQDDCKFIVWTGNPHAAHDFLASQAILELFSDIRVKTDRIKCDLLIDDDRMMLKVSKRFAAKAVHIDDFNANPSQYL